MLRERPSVDVLTAVFFWGGVNQARVQEFNKATKMGLGQ